MLASSSTSPRVDPEQPTEPGRRERTEPRGARGDRGPLEAGTRIGEYVVDSRRGSGGFATVYRARDTRDGSTVALKVLHAFLARTPSILQRFRREAATIARLEHPSIVRLLGAGDPDGVPYIAMEWVEGPTLAELVRDRGPLMLDEAMPILESLGAVLAAAHEAGVIHRDLKAANVALAGRDVKLLDFGIAKLLDAGGSGVTSTGSRLGTPHYMSPEQVAGRPIDHRTDIYAFGILVFELLTGRRPFDGGSPVEIEERQLVEPPPLASRFAGVPVAVDAAICRAMAKDPAKRHGTITELLDELRAIGAGAANRERPARRLAVGLYIHGELRGDDPSDAALDRLDEVIAEVRAAAGTERIEVVAELGSSLLLVGIPAAGESTRHVLDRAEAFATRVSCRSLHPELLVAVTVHVAELELGGVIRGPLLDVAAWTRTDVAGVFVTDAARR